MAEEMVKLIDTSLCTGCRACQVACKSWNDNKASLTEFTGVYENPPRLEPNTWTKIRFFEGLKGEDHFWYLMKWGCMHCDYAACVGVCPTGAMHKAGGKKNGEPGFVAVDTAKCIGCNYCVSNCPFQIPQYDPVQNNATKCTLCTGKFAEGDEFARVVPKDKSVEDSFKKSVAQLGIPACISSCPTGALGYVKRAELDAELKSRVAFIKDSLGKKACVYGAKVDGADKNYALEGIGGTSVVMLLVDEAGEYKLPEAPKVSGLVKIWEKPGKFILTALLGLGIVFNLIGAGRNKPKKA